MERKPFKEICQLCKLDHEDACDFCRKYENESIEYLQSKGYKIENDQQIEASK